VLPIVLSTPEVDELMREAERGRPFEIDLEKQTVNGAIAFEIGARAKRMLLEGLDELGLTLALEPRIAAFQAADRARRPWIYAGVSNAQRRPN